MHFHEQPTTKKMRVLLQHSIMIKKRRKYTPCNTQCNAWVLINGKAGKAGKAVEIVLIF